MNTKIIFSSVLFLFFASTVFSQIIPTDPTSHKFLYEGVVKIDSMKSEQIFKKAREWTLRNLKSSDSNVNLDDKDYKSLTSTGNIHLQNRMGLHNYSDMNLNFKFTIFVKDGRYKYIIENLYISYHKDLLTAGSSLEELDFGTSNKEKVYTEVNLKINSLLKEFETFIKANSDSKNDW